MSAPMVAETGTIAMRFGRFFSQWQEWVWAMPTLQEGAWAGRVRALLRIFLIVCREFTVDRIPLRASALTFAIVLSMVPMLALGTSVLKGLGAGGQMRQVAYSFIERLESTAKVPIPAEGELPTPVPADAPKTAAEPGTGKSMTSHLTRAVDQVFDYVERTNFAALGAFGIFGLVVTVLSVLSSIEEAMNSIWKADRGRPIGRKILDYFALMVILPVTINLLLAIEATLQSPKLFMWFYGLLPVAWLGSFLLAILPFAIVVSSFSLLYRFLPNTYVQVFPAFAGGLVGGMGWLFVQSFYVDLQIGVSNYNAIYGSFATLPLFLLWLYAGWMIFLVGAEVAYAIQEWRGYVREEARLPPSLRLAIAFTILEVANKDFHQRAVTSSASLARRIRQPAGFVRVVLEDLLRAGVMRRVLGAEEGYLPAMPEEELLLGEVVDAVLGAEVGELEASNLAQVALDGAKLALTGNNTCLVLAEEKKRVEASCGDGLD